MTSQYSIAIHVLSLIHLYPESATTSDAIAASVGTNPVVVRRIIGSLSRAGLLLTQQGVAGARLARSPKDMSLLDVYRAVDGKESVFKIHEHPHPQCPVGSRIQGALESVYGDAQEALEAQLSRTTLADVALELTHT